MAAQKQVSMDLVLNYKETKQLVTSCIEAQEPIMLHGGAGIGKSDMMKAIARDAGRELIDIRLALLDSVDIRGYPYLKDLPDGSKALSFAMNEEFPSDSESTAIIFFDEINAAMPSTQLAMYQMILDRAIGNYQLPKGVSMVAAGNRESDKGGTTSMPKPLENRFIHVELNTTFNDWVDHAIGSNIHPEIIGYLAKNESKLCGFDPRTSSRAFPTPRSWFKASKMLRLTEKQGDKSVYHAISGCVGTPVATEFQAFRKIAKDIPDTMSILNGTAPELTTAGADLAFMIISNCLYKIREVHDDKKELASNTATYLDNFFQYLMDNDKKIGKEYAVLSLTTAFQRYKIPINREVKSINKMMVKYGSFLQLVEQIDR